MSPAGFAQRHRAAVALAAVLLFLIGLWAMITLPAGIYPEVAFPRIAIIAHGGTFEPRDMVVAVTRPLEEAVSGAVDLRRVRSRTVRGAAELKLDFRPGADMNFALQQVQGRIAGIQGELPPDLVIQTERLTPSVFPMMQFELIGADPVVLRDLAQYSLRPRLARLPDVGEVDVQGGLVREVSVILDPARLVSARVSAAEVADRIRSANVVEATGRVDREYRQVGVLVSGLAATPEAVGEIVVRSAGATVLRVRDLGQVRYGSEDLFEITRGNGQPAALLNVSRQPTGNTLRLERAVLAMADTLRAGLPAGVRLDLVYDQARLVRESIGSVRDAMLIGGLLAVGVLLFFLGDWRVTLIAALTVPLTIVGTFAGLALFGDSLNLMSLGGLAVAVGLVIDDAVVVVENLDRRLRGTPPAERARRLREAADEILGPVAGSTFTTVVVFAPLALLQGVVGQFFKSFALALGIAVLLSLLLALLLVPSLADAWLGERLDSKGAGPVRRLARTEAIHRGLVDRAMRSPLAVGASVVLLAVIGLGASRAVGSGFLPQMDEGGFILDYWTPAGTSLAETDRQVGRIEAILRADSAVQAFTRRTGSELGFFATAPHQGDMTVLLKPRRERSASVFEVINRVRDRIETEVPAVRTEYPLILQDLLGDLAGSPEPIEIKVFNPEVRVAERAGVALAEGISSVPGLEDLFDGTTGDVPSLRVALEPVRLARLGITAEDATRQARASLFGLEAGAVREPDRLVPIRVRLTDSMRLRGDVVAQLPVVGPGGWAPLGSLGQVAEGNDPSELSRENLRPMVAVTGAVDVEHSTLGQVMREIRARVARVPLPAGVTYEFGGQYASQQESFRQLLLVFGLAAGLVLLVMVFQFGSFRGPLLILLAASLGLTGAVVALWITGVPFNVSSFMGLILLVGLVVKNGIIMLDAAIRLRREGRDPLTALEEAGSLRLRPILMTTLCTLAGLFPLALGIGSGAELQQPLAIAVIGGLTLSTGVTLILLPPALRAARALDHAGATPQATAAPPPAV
jgi:CzcA family heavy metal efflux pump